MRPYRYVEYARMSEPGQNPRSPDRQFATIDETVARLGYHWERAGSFQDERMSDRDDHKRPVLQALHHDVAASLINVDLVLCDTYERFGRSDETAEIRRKLEIDHGVIVVTVDTNFVDPTGA